MTLTRDTVVRSSAVKRSRNSAVKNTPRRRPPGTVPGRMRRLRPRRAAQRRISGIAKSDRSPAANTGWNPSFTVLMTTWLKPKSAEKSTSDVAPKASIRSFRAMWSSPSAGPAKAAGRGLSTGGGSGTDMLALGGRPCRSAPP